MTEKTGKRVRYQILDELRGLVFLSMVLYHGMWDLVYMFGYEAQWYQETAGYIWQQSICWSFILLSGFCWTFGRKKYRHAGLVFGGGLLVTLVTCVFLPEDRVIFGVLTLPDRRQSAHSESRILPDYLRRRYQTHPYSAVRPEVPPALPLPDD